MLVLGPEEIQGFTLGLRKRFKIFQGGNCKLRQHQFDKLFFKIQD